MIFWDRIVKNLQNSLDIVRKWARIIADRTRVEAGVARVLVEKGKVEKRLELSYRKTGERVFQQIEAGEDVNTSDPVLLETLEDIRDARKEIRRLNESVREITESGLTDEAVAGGSS